MKAEVRLTIPDNAEATITIHGTIREMKAVRQHLNENMSKCSWPLSEFTRAVALAIAEAEQVWVSEEAKSHD